jgi:two-component system phosphate regulon response regulator PhoB
MLWSSEYGGRFFFCGKESIISMANVSGEDAVSYILFAEDDLVSQELIQEMLTLSGYTVEVTNNGVDALAIALERKPQLILLDVMMPLKSGLEVTRAVKTHYGDEAPPIILITALGSLDDIEQGRLAGADDYIIKPFSPEILRNKVRAATKET